MASTQSLTRKVGPLPVWAWAVIGLAVGYYLYKKYAGASSTASTTATPAADTSTTGTGLDSGSSAPASGQGSAADQLNSDLIASLAGNLEGVNSNLTQGLLGTTSSIEGLGAEALAQEGAIAQSVIYQQGANGGYSYGGGSSGYSTPAAAAPAPSTGGGWSTPSAVFGVPGGFVVTSASGGVAINAPVQAALNAGPPAQSFKAVPAGYVG